MEHKGIKGFKVSKAHEGIRGLKVHRGHRENMVVKDIKDIKEDRVFKGQVPQEHKVHKAQRFIL